MRPFKPDVVVALDFGGSLTKVLYQSATFTSPHVLVMPPEIAQTTERAVKGATGGGFGIQALPESSAWVKVGTEYWAVGDLARQLHAPPGLSGVKWERAIIKALAVLWVIQQQLQLERKFKVAIACVLPPGEYEDRHRFETKLREALASFETPTGLIQINLGKSHFSCLPECAGVAMLYRKAQRVQVPGVVAFLMLGYRNASLLLSRNGSFGIGSTCDLGFVRSIEQIQQQTSGLKVDSLLRAIDESHRMKNAAPYMQIVPIRDEAIRTQEARRLVEVVAAAKDAYAKMLIAWFDEVLPLADVPELAFYGGTTEIMQQNLSQYRPQLTHHFNVGVDLPDTINLQGLGHRLADIYGVWGFVSQQWQVRSDAMSTVVEVA